MLSSEGCLESCKNFFNRHAPLKHFQNLPDHNSCAFESRRSTADFTVRDNILINFDSHAMNNNNSVFKGFENDKLGIWIEVRDLSVGMEITVQDYPTGAIKWEKIASIKDLEPQHVYDLAIEVTRNFIAPVGILNVTGTTTTGGNISVGSGANKFLLCGNSTSGFFELRDDDDAGWTRCSALDGVLTCQIGAGSCG